MYSYTLKNAIPLVIDRERGHENKCYTIKVSFKGRRGLSAIDSFQDAVLKNVMSLATDMDNKEDKKQVKKLETIKEVGNDQIEGFKIKEKNSQETPAKFLQSVDLGGGRRQLNKIVLLELEEYAKIENLKLIHSIQDMMAIEDLDALVRGVLEHFLLPRLTQVMTNIVK